MTTHNVATLLAYDCWSLLGEAEIARVAWQGADGIALVPVNYAVGEAAIWFRVEPESKLARECDGQQVVVEVDRVDSETRTAWSVVVVGIAHLVDELDVPDTLIEMRVWPGGPRRRFVRVEPDRLTGRRLLSA
ncbi:pyridoxamine 5'-phosphate oxidase family protein [Nocardioides aquiterrae]|uniref:Pyridoxamine 5'-phosphate oxidase family protein n=1 Tax=Nocardioides aquiterrae TaxID=203799 RepID=A0ABP4FBJ8_9ACTN